MYCKFYKLIYIFISAHVHFKLSILRFPEKRAFKIFFVFTGAGVLDILNPTQILPGSQGTSQGTNSNENNNNNPLTGIQNLFNNFNILNGTNGNPLQSLFSGNALNGAKVFVIATQGLVMPVDTILKGFTSLFQGLPNIPGLSNLPFPQFG